MAPRKLPCKSSEVHRKSSEGARLKLSTTSLTDALHASVPEKLVPRPGPRKNLASLRGGGALNVNLHRESSRSLLADAPSLARVASTGGLHLRLGARQEAAGESLGSTVCALKPLSSTYPGNACNAAKLHGDAVRACGSMDPFGMVPSQSGRLGSSVGGIDYGEGSSSPNMMLSGEVDFCLMKVPPLTCVTTVVKGNPAGGTGCSPGLLGTTSPETWRRLQRRPGRLSTEYTCRMRSLHSM
eukprot:TRINITY_DN38472_c0_g1_i1.p1 TRINITY_DN38472_c0_g1~~TRINITY_DN38472_c0_g1_i1.p1  ORF type:complete len:275 (+),score=35.35 TRINITY_DN38472_c0_g1_i1:105-827(+)